MSDDTELMIALTAMLERKTAQNAKDPNVATLSDAADEVERLLSGKPATENPEVERLTSKVADDAAHKRRK